MQFATVNGVTLHYDLTDAGSGKPVLVFSNSLGTDFRIWDELTAAFRSDFRVLRYDKRGHGLSETGTTPYRIEDHSGDLAALLDHLALSSVIAVGLSVGGMIVQDLAARRPDLVTAVVLCDTAHKIGSAEMWAERIAALEAGGLASMLDAVMERWFTPAFRTDDNPVYAGCRQMFVRQGLAGYVATCHALKDGDLTESTSNLSLPVLCLVGDQDGSTTPELVKGTADIIKGSEFVVIEGAGHIPCVEQPEKQEAAMRTFFARHGLPGGVNE